jgi:hypothetical protein
MWILFFSFSCDISTSCESSDSTSCPAVSVFPLLLLLSFFTCSVFVLCVIFPNLFFTSWTHALSWALSADCVTKYSCAFVSILGWWHLVVVYYFVCQCFQRTTSLSWRWMQLCINVLTHHNTLSSSKWFFYCFCPSETFLEFIKHRKS